MDEAAPFTRSAAAGLDHGGYIIAAGLAAMGGGLLFEGWDVMVHGARFDMVAFGAMCAQLLGAMGAAVGGWEYLRNRNPGGAQP